MDTESESPDNESRFGKMNSLTTYGSPDRDRSTETISDSGRIFGRHPTDISVGPRKSQSSFFEPMSPSSPRARTRSRRGSLIGAKQDSRFQLDPRASLKAFRMIGGFGGVGIDELRHVVSQVQDENVRKPLMTNLANLFEKCDLDDDGRLDVLEFEKLIQSSTLVQQAVYEMLERAKNEERNAYMVDDASATAQSNHWKAKYIDIGAVITTLTYVLILAVQADVEPGWPGWHVVEIVFLIMFSLEICFRCLCKAKQQKEQHRLSIFCWSFASPMFVFDLIITAIGWVDVCIILLEDKSTSIVTTLRWIRVFRMARCARLVRVFWYCHELRALIEGIFSGMKSAIWGLALIVLIVFVWAVAIRTAVSHQWTSDSSGALSEAFSSTPESMMTLFRCMALSADGACLDKHQKSVFYLLSEELGWVFNACWITSEVFILIGILNVIASMFVVQAAENANKIKLSINAASFREDSLRIQKLDKLLRTLIHPGREQSNPKDRNAAEVAAMIRTDHPEAAGRMPNLESQLVHFARNIQDAKKLHQSAMDVYEAQEVTACRELRSIPCAKTYMIDGEEALRVEDMASISNHLNLPMAPLGAVEVLLLQEQESLEALLDEACEVQQFVKSVIYPNSSWATDFKAGPSGNIWKLSKGLCDEAIDPGPKSLERIEQKVAGKYGGRYQRNRDYCRLSLIYNSVSHLIQAIPRFLDYRLDSDDLQVASLENRFMQPHPLGWRDVTMLLKVKVPSSITCDAETHHIMEVQMRLKGLTEVCHEGHKFYEEIRANLPDELVTTILDRLVTDTTLDLGITKSEWLECLPNQEVLKLLDDLGIPRRNLKSLFDIIDIDGSGTVTSSELQEMLLLVKDPVHAHEVAGCHFRVRDIQRQLQTRLEPQLTNMQSYAMKCMDAQEYLIDELYWKIEDSISRIGETNDRETSGGNRSSAWLDSSASSAMSPARIKPPRPRTAGSHSSHLIGSCSFSLGGSASRRLGGVSSLGLGSFAGGTFPRKGTPGSPAASGALVAMKEAYEGSVMSGSICNFSSDAASIPDLRENSGESDEVVPTFSMEQIPISGTSSPGRWPKMLKRQESPGLDASTKEIRSRAPEPCMKKRILVSF